MPKLVKDIVPTIELELARHKAVIAQFPDASAHYYKGFQSKAVNKTYTNWLFERGSFGVWVLPYIEIPFEHAGKTEVVRVHTSPRASRLCYVNFAWGPNNKKEIRFSKISFNLKSNGFTTADKLITDLHLEIMLFVQKNSKLPINDKHLEPRLKNLLSFI
jgi:hypothetical protein